LNTQTLSETRLKGGFFSPANHKNPTIEKGVRMAITEQDPAKLPQPLMTRVTVQAAVPKLVDRTFNHHGNQIRLAEQIAQNHSK
jgi:hypothetical protein